MCDLYENKDEVARTILTGNYKSRDFIISTYNGHPNAYVSFPEAIFIEDFSYDILNDEIPLGTIHGGLSAFGILNGKLMLGWDYGYADDYNACKPNWGGEKWNIPSIMEEIIALIDFLDLKYGKNK